MQSESRELVPAWPVYGVLGILVVFSAVFLYELIRLSADDTGVPDEELNADTYLDRVMPLLENADPGRGAELLQARGCEACHGGENAGRLAPDHNLLAEVAGERRPPLSPEAYIYESILYPGAYHVDGFPDNMPRKYGDLLSEEEIGDIIAYLLIPRTNAPGAPPNSASSTPAPES